MKQNDGAADDVRERTFKLISRDDDEITIKNIEALRNYGDRALLQTIIDSIDNGGLELKSRSAFHKKAKLRTIDKLAPQKEKEELIQRVMFEYD